MPDATRTNADELRQLATAHGLTQRQLADLAGVSIKTVEAWLAAPQSKSRRRMPDRALRLVRATLPGYLAGLTASKGNP